MVLSYTLSMTQSSFRVRMKQGKPPPAVVYRQEKRCCYASVASKANSERGSLVSFYPPYHNVLIYVGAIIKSERTPHTHLFCNIVFLAFRLYFFQQGRVCCCCYPSHNGTSDAHSLRGHLSFAFQDTVATSVFCHCAYTQHDEPTNTCDISLGG